MPSEFSGVKSVCLFSQSASDASLLRTTSYGSLLLFSLTLLHRTSTIFLPISSPPLVFTSPPVGSRGGRHI
ncbi:hypothetical protein CHARACLAT_028374 [Characodon lateralis]|uniref:Uncharacterized protein n=1 Tax=Characodon lateralis TaxID=208331 RepID=A0ABU7CRZ1_9TELE|nr:hypothetical protein [Characodon lateralis]